MPGRAQTGIRFSTTPRLFVQVEARCFCLPQGKRMEISGLPAVPPTPISAYGNHSRFTCLHGEWCQFLLSHQLSEHQHTCERMVAITCSIAAYPWHLPSFCIADILVALLVSYRDPMTATSRHFTLKWCPEIVIFNSPPESAALVQQHYTHIHTLLGDKLINIHPFMTSEHKGTEKRCHGFHRFRRPSNKGMGGKRQSAASHTLIC